MTLRLILESSSQPQARTEARLADGQLSIGRGEDCGWQLVDPNMFVSRRHAVITGQGGQYRVTDESSGGLFIDAAPAPLGQGAVAALTPGMRLRLGDFVIRVEMDGIAAAAEPVPKPDMFGDDFFTPRPEAPPPPRPATLPDPFEAQRGAGAPLAAEPPRIAPPAFFDDPFTLDHGPRAVQPAPDPAPAAPAGGFDFGDFDLPDNLLASVPAPSASAPPPQPLTLPPTDEDPFADEPSRVVIRPADPSAVIVTPVPPAAPVSHPPVSHP